MNTFRVLDQLEQIIRSNLHIPLTGLVFMDGEKVLAALEKVRASLPEELKHAQFLTQENQRILRESQEKAELLLKEAEEKAKKIAQEADERGKAIQKTAEERADAMIKLAEEQAARKISESEIVKLAHEQASHLMQQAERASRETKDAADQYASQVLTKLEQELQRLVSVVRKGKEKLEEDKRESSLIPDNPQDQLKEIIVKD